MFLRVRHLAAFALVWVGCSVVRDADRFSEGSGGLSNGGGGGSGGTGNCMADGAVCASSDDCCFGACIAGSCQCIGEGTACNANEDCCSDLCSNGLCGPCGDVAAACGGVNHPPCCRGRACVTDAGGTETCQVDNACASYATKLASQDLHQILTSCSQADGGEDCVNWNPAEQPRCYQLCVATKLAISEDCASCYAYWWLTCLPGQCVGLDCTTTYSTKCADCCNDVCLNKFKQCTGFATCPEPSP